MIVDHRWTLKKYQQLRRRARLAKKKLHYLFRDPYDVGSNQALAAEIIAEETKHRKRSRAP